MTYGLGIDLGTTFVAAAVARPSGVEMITLGDRTVVTPAVVHLCEDGSVITGDAANRRAVSHPDLVGREFKRKLGDPTPIMLSNVPYPVTALLGALLRDVMQKVVALEGEQPQHVVLTHPANWGPFRRELFEEVPLAAGVESPQLVTEPEAAAAYYATTRMLNDGETVAVYDLGGGTFDATVVRKTAAGLEILGTPEGIERLGGVDFDESILSYVNYTAGGALSELDMSDPQTAVALARLRQDCVQAKESLSLDQETIIPVFLPGRHFEVKLTRAGFEDMVRAPVESTIGALARTVKSAGLRPADLSSVLLVGGSSRIPLIAEMVEQEFGRPVVVNAHPKYAVALGAASIAAATVPAATGAPTAAPLPSPEPGAWAAAPAMWADPIPTVATPAPTAAPAPAFQPGGTVTGGYAPGPPTIAYGGPNGSGGPGGPGGPGRPSEPPTDPRQAPVPPRPPAPPSWRKPALIGAAALATVLVLGLAYLLWPGPSASTSTAANPTAAPTAAPTETAEIPTVAPPPPPITPKASTAQPTVAGVIRVAKGPQSGSVTPDGKLAYVTSTGTNAISVVDLATNATIGVIPISAGPPEYVTFTKDGRTAYVSVYDPIQKVGNVVLVIDTASRTVTGSIPADSYPYAMALSPNGRQLYVPNHDSNLVSVIDTTTNTVVNKIAVKPNPHDAAFSVDGRRAYVANHKSNLVTVLDTKNGAVLTEIPVAKSPHSIAMSPDGARVYVVNYDADLVTVIDPAAMTVTGTIPVQREPQCIAFSPDSKHAYVVNNGSNSLTVIDTATGQVTATVGVGQTPTDVFVDNDGTHAYVTNISSNDVTVLNIAA